MVAVSRGDYQSAAKMLIDDPKLARCFLGEILADLLRLKDCFLLETEVKCIDLEIFFLRHRDFTCGYTALHWACKHGNLDMVKLLAGTYQVTMSRQTHVQQILYKYVAGQH